LAFPASARSVWERERLRQAAERVHAGRLSRIDELAASFAEIEGTGRSTQIFDEMTLILAEEGVDQALAYAATQRTGILEKVKARAAAAREKNPVDLLPLLKSAQLQADRNQPAEAARLFTDILALEPDWPDALDAQFWFQITQAHHAFDHATLVEASGHLYAAETAVQRLLKAEPDTPRSQRDLSFSNDRVGDVQRAQGDLAGALKSYRDSLALESARSLPSRTPAMRAGSAISP
jgi:tetratricopeptide (TPR) repeat protein